MTQRSQTFRISLLSCLLAAAATAVAMAAAVVKTEVSITSGKFTPASITIKPGQTITWINNDLADHTIEADDGSFNSGKIKPGKKFEYRFDTAGTFTYCCGLHPREKGKVLVKK